MAVRSSAYGEDSDKQSYAGQFKSFLNCPPKDIFDAYKKVIASRFKYAIAIYDRKSAIDEAALPMAVGVQQMIDVQTAGVAYSTDPSTGCANCLLISANFGLGVGIVEGLTRPDCFKVSRLDPNRIIYREIAQKEIMMVPDKTKGVKSVRVDETHRGQACLNDAQVIELAEKTLMLERYFKQPVDIEWCFDNRGDLYLLQCRPLKLSARPWIRAKDLQAALADKPVIMEHLGQVAQRGIAVGKVWQVKEDDDPSSLPVGAIAVTRYTTPRMTAIIRRAAAIITDIGSPNGHMATVAREFGVPMIVNTGKATSLLQNDREITVDAEENVIYDGIVEELLEYEIEPEDVFRDLREYQILRRLLRRISPLFLIDPNRSDFKAKNCRTYHDIARFSHEKAVKRLINLNVSSRDFRDIESRRLKLEIPLGLSLVDLGGGLDRASRYGDIDSLDKIKCQPLRALLKGITSPGAWSTQPMQLGLNDLFSSLTRFSMTDRGNEYRGQNLAVISVNYANISFRLGYHFNVIDTYVSDNINDNYIYFRFVGGVTETERRHLRAILIKKILERLNFKVTVNSDLVVGRLKKWSATETLRILEEIGRLIGFTRQLDTQMQDENSVEKCFRDFFAQK